MSSTPPDVPGAIGLLAKVAQWMRASRKTGGLGYSAAQMTKTNLYKGLLALGATAAIAAGTTAVLDPPVFIGTPSVPAVTVLHGGGGAPVAMAAFSSTTSPGCTSANVWVNTTAGGAPTRSASPAAYSAGSAFGSILSALDGASSGDLICVKAGSYPALVTVNTGFASATTIRAEAPLAVTIGTTNGSIDLANGQGNHLTWDGFILPGGVDGTNGSNSTVFTSDHFTNDALCVGVWTSGQCVNFHDTQDLQFTHDTFGPMCCGNNAPFSATAHNSPEAIRLGIPGPSGGQSFNNTVITNDLFQGALRQCSIWPAHWMLNGVQQTGPCPDNDCANFATCHVDQIHIWGLQNSTISQNWFWNTDCQGISLTGSNGSTNSNDTIDNNFVDGTSSFDSCGSPAIGFQDCGGGAPSDGFAGTMNVAFNTVIGYISFDPAVMDNCDAAGTTWNFVGDVGRFYNPSDSGCGTGSGSTINFLYDYWSTFGSGINCPGTGGVTTGTDPTALTWLTQTDGSLISFDLHDTGVSAPGSPLPDGMVPAATCTTYTTVDLDGQTRPAGTNCDAGADER